MTNKCQKQEPKMGLKKHKQTPLQLGEQPYSLPNQVLTA